MQKIFYHEVHEGHEEEIEFIICLLRALRDLSGSIFFLFAWLSNA